MPFRISYTSNATFTSLKEMPAVKASSLVEATDKATELKGHGFKNVIIYDTVTAKAVEVS